MRSMTKTVLALGFGLVLLGGLGGLALAQDVKTNYVPGTDFSKYKTYKWVAIPGGEQVNQIMDQQIKMAVDQQLSSKGLTKKDADPVDMYVGYQVSVNQQRQWNAYGGGMGWRFGGGMASATSSTLDVGTIGLDFYDPSPQTLIWRGEATKTMDSKADSEKIQKNLDKAMEKLLKDFPPKS
jgi:Domain of unknown function (DUF4136)